MEAARPDARHAGGMTSRRPIPESLTQGPFHVREARVRGVPKHRLRAGDLNAEVYGMRLAGGAVTFEQRCALFQRRMPETAFFSHVTAARILGIPLPWAVESETLLHIAVPSPARAPHAAGLRGHKLRVGPRDVVVWSGGMRVTSPLRTWLDLGGIVPLLDLVAAGDYLIHWRGPLVSRAELTQALDGLRGRRGRQRLLRAAELLNDRAESAPESKLRAVLVLAGLPEPRVNLQVTDRFGEFVARTDLRIDEYRIILEYQGDYHRTTPGQWRADMSRRSRLEAQGWRVLEVNADDLKDPAELVQRIRAFARLPRLPRPARVDL